MTHLTLPESLTVFLIFWKNVFFLLCSAIRVVILRFRDCCVLNIITRPPSSLCRSYPLFLAMWKYCLPEVVESSPVQIRLCSLVLSLLFTFLPKCSVTLPKSLSVHSHVSSLSFPLTSSPIIPCSSSLLLSRLSHVLYQGEHFHLVPFPYQLT